MKPKIHLHKLTDGFIRSHLVGLLAGIGLASIAIFGRNTVESAMSFVKEMRRDGYATTASASVSASEITFNTTTVPLPPTFWQESKQPIGTPQLFEETPANPPLIVTSLHQRPSRDPEITEESLQTKFEPQPESTPPHAPTPTPEPAFDKKALQKALHENLASVFTGDLPYILLKSGDRLYAGSKLTEGVTLEAISPTAILCSTPDGILKIASQRDEEAFHLEVPQEKAPLPLDAKPEAPESPETL